MKINNGEIQYNGKTYKLVFNLNVMEQIQEEYGSVNKWASLTDAEEPNAKAVIYGMTVMANEGIDIENEENGTQIPFLTTKQMGRILSNIGMETATSVMNSTVVESIKDDVKNG